MSIIEGRERESWDYVYRPAEQCSQSVGVTLALVCCGVHSDKLEVVKQQGWTAQDENVNLCIVQRWKVN